MFRIVCDPSPGSTELCLIEITRGGSQIFFMCCVGVWQHNFEPAVCVHSTTGWELVVHISRSSILIISSHLDLGLPRTLHPQQMKSYNLLQVYLAIMV